MHYVYLKAPVQIVEFKRSKRRRSGKKQTKRIDEIIQQQEETAVPSLKDLASELAGIIQEHETASNVATSSSADGRSLQSAHT